ncbi:tRNA (adenosine(37)-N6)-threonylcarbamoyltransferase complex dimerization subunit type 1 TsaB [bacterium]|nr:tRNA (adenosine(37)-N6)-threonylcarbamoyltransferase complex dimerization subunit type 1 TsaB [bacterium]MBQ9150031.1 tRNA (adenosine(37)-N6)-threonylcarbamoyltransferase complex dimerization subunit type 1 TsaB [bacterium]
MNILAICAALNNSYFAIKYNNKIASEIIKSDENYHSLYLISKIKETCSMEEINLDSLDLIAVNCGPGSFTGIRVAMSIAKVIAGELNLPLVCLNTAEILLEAYNKDILLMDARRDMYFVGTKEKIELVQKDKVADLIKNKNILCDSNCNKIYPDSICYENEDKNLGEIMLNLAIQKYNNSNNKDEFNYLKSQANYIQTPPIF